MPRTVLIAFVLFVALAGTMQACGAGSRQRALSASLATANASRDGFLLWDRSHQDDIVAHAESLADGQQKLSDYRAKRSKVEDAFALVYAAIAFAATEEDAPLEDVLRTAKALAAAIEAIRSPPTAEPAPDAAPASGLPAPVVVPPLVPASP